MCIPGGGGGKKIEPGLQGVLQRVSIFELKKWECQENSRNGRNNTHLPAPSKRSNDLLANLQICKFTNSLANSLGENITAESLEIVEISQINLTSGSERAIEKTAKFPSFTIARLL